MTISEDATFGLRTVRDGSTCELILQGEVDIATTGELRRSADGLLALPGCQRLVIDLAEVTFLDSSGIATLIEINEQAGTTNRTLTLRRPAARVTKVLHLTGLESVFTIQQ